MDVAACAAMNRAAYSAAVAESTMVEIMTDRYKIGALGLEPGLSLPKNMNAPALDRDLDSERYDASECTCNCMSEACILILALSHLEAY
jgi:hypothetical protein